MSVNTDMLDLYINAEKAVLKNQAYTIGGRSLTRANLDDIREGRDYWQSRVDAETASSQGGSSLFAVADFTK